MLTIGPAGNDAAWAAEQAAGEGISVLHADLRFAKPLDEGLLHRIGREFRRVITVGGRVINGGVGAAVLAFVEPSRLPLPYNDVGVEDRFVAHGNGRPAKEMCGYDAPGILRRSGSRGRTSHEPTIDGRVTEQADTADGPDTDCACVSVPERNKITGTRAP
ncbi:MAG: transketolase C-terminal domain-containing protein [Alistipes indistinctus]